MILEMTDYGLTPGCGRGAGPLVARALADAKAAGEPVTLRFAPGVYDFLPAQATRRPLYISNTIGERDLPGAWRNIGVDLRGVDNLTIDGQGAVWRFLGPMTYVAAQGCRNLTLRGLTVDMPRPTMSEMTVEAVDDGGMTCRVHPDSAYVIDGDRLFFVGEGWRFDGVGPWAQVQQYDPETRRTWRTPYKPLEHARLARELAPGRVRLQMDRRPEVAAGQVFQMRRGHRTEVGFFFEQCRGVRLENLSVRYMHGLGVVGQFTDDITLEHVCCAPDPASGRTCAAFADFVHLSGCGGRVLLRECTFCGAHDDVLNVHGTHLKVVDQPAPDALVVRFMHPETYGFEAFFPGDEIALVASDTLLAERRAVVARAEMLDPRAIRLTLKAPVELPDGGDFVVDNLSHYPEVEVCGCDLSVVPTRGVLVTTRRRVNIHHNHFFRLGMSALSIADDAASWYESGPISQVDFHHNLVIGCGSPAVLVCPESARHVQDQWVHGQLEVRRNVVVLENPADLLLQAKSVRRLVVRDNVICAPDAWQLRLALEHCPEPEAADNRVVHDPR